jgi:hypothetical protein
VTKEQLRDFLVEKLGICGCSEWDGALDRLVDLLDTGEMRQAGMHEEADAVLDDFLPDGDVFGRNLAVYWLTAAGLIEHGSRLDAYELSALGAEVLEALREHGTSADLWELTELDLLNPSLN